MSFSPNDSAIKLDASLEEKIHAASSQYEIAELLKEAACSQSLCVRDKYSPDILLALDRPAPGTPTAFVKTVTVEGTTHHFEGATDAEANEKLLAFVRETANEPAERPRERDSESGRFVARTDDPVAMAELEIKLRTGQISTEQYLSESGAIERHLEAQGVSIEALKAATNERTTAGWQSATQEFLQTSDWPGGERNRDLLGQVLIKMGAAESPNAENLKRAYQYMRDNDLLVPNAELEAVKAIGAATSPEALRAAAQASQGRSSSMFSR
jgi:hypothetical protein